MSKDHSHHLTPGYSTQTMREWQSSSANVFTPSNFVYPIFVTDVSPTLQRPIAALPGQFHLGTEQVVTFLRPLVEKKGLRAVILFGVPTQGSKDNEGTLADSPTGPVVTALANLRRAFTGDQLLLLADVCVCAYTSHGHCGIVRNDGKLDNAASVRRLAEISVSYARAGADVIAPSDMMDARIAAIKEKLRGDGFQHIPVMSYSAKFASCLYGPFRSASTTNLKGDRKQYQLPPGSEGLARRAVQRDIAEGADFVMVKPGTLYLDVIRMCRDVAQGRPVAVYHVSGEYAMLWHAANNNAFDLKTAVMETMVAFRRAGADIILTYYTPQILDWIRERVSRDDIPSKL